MERPEIQLYLKTAYVGGVLPRTGITVSQAVPSLITYRCTELYTMVSTESDPTKHSMEYQVSKVPNQNP
jgi:hypothetical protein